MKQIIIFISFFIAITVCAQDNLQTEQKFMQANKDTLAQKMMLNLFLMKNSQYCSIEEFAQLVLGNKYHLYFPISSKPLKDRYIKKFMKSEDFAAFKKEKAKVFGRDPIYQKSYNRSTEHTFSSFSNMGFSLQQTVNILLTELKKNKLYVTYAIFEEIFQKK